MKNKKYITIVLTILFILISTIVLANSNEGRLYHYFFHLFSLNESKSEEMKGKIVNTEENIAEKRIPILMYHHVANDNLNSATITPALLEEHMKAIAQEGYTALTSEDLIDFVENGKTLPEKVVLITFDDGYASNYEYAYPILAKYHLKGTIFIIGSSVGKTKYKNTEYDILPHFSYEQALEMENSGVISIENHTYDMHQWEPFEEGEEVRKSAVKLTLESEEGFQQVLTDDFLKMQAEFQKNLHKEIHSFAYPGGVYDDLSNQILEELGISLTFSTVQGHETIVRGDKNSLKSLKRMNVCEEVATEEILAYLAK